MFAISESVVAAGATAGIMLGCFLVVWAMRGGRAGREPATGREAGPGAGAAGQTTNELTRQLIDELDRKTERLERLLARVEEAERRVVRVGLAEGVAAGVVEGGSEERVAGRVDTGAFLNDDPSNAMIFEMAEQGRTSQEIAAALDRPAGQVELVLNLRRASRRGAG